MNNLELKKGYTTGSCAAAATKGAVIGAVTGTFEKKVGISTPSGKTLSLELIHCQSENGVWSCSIKKYSGDDPDVTNGTLISSSVKLTKTKDIVLIGGKGVGRVTKPGLACKVGEAAINPVPREMIIKVAEEVLREHGFYGGAEITISVPKGEELAAKTFNPKLGIVGGISILGTSGIVEPMSEQALIDTIEVELKVRKAEGKEYIVITPGNYGKDFLKNETTISEDFTVKCSNFIGEALDFAVDMGFAGIIFSGHLGKLVKVAGGVFNTHSKYGDRRMDIFMDHSKKAGATKETLDKIKECVMVDEAVSIIKEAGYMTEVMGTLIDEIYNNIKERTLGKLEIGVMTFSNEYGLLGSTKNIDEMIKKVSGGK